VAPAIVGFSRDGGRVYGAASNGPFELGLRPLLAVDLVHGNASEIDRLPDRLADTAASGGSADLARVDPSSGRMFGPPGPSASQVTVYAPDGVRPTSSVGGGHILGVAWGPRGMLAVLRTDPTAAASSASATTVQLVDPEYGLTDLLATGPTDDGALLAGPDGYLLALLAAGSDDELVAIRIEDGAAAATLVPLETLASLRFLGWLPPG
jgi:hypothetical protein